MSFKEIGERLGISDCRVEQIHNAALRKLRNALRNDLPMQRLFSDHIDRALASQEPESESTGRHYTAIGKLTKAGGK